MIQNRFDSADHFSGIDNLRRTHPHLRQAVATTRPQPENSQSPSTADDDAVAARDELEHTDVYTTQTGSTIHLLSECEALTIVDVETLRLRPLHHCSLASTTFGAEKAGNACVEATAAQVCAGVQVQNLCSTSASSEPS